MKYVRKTTPIRNLKLSPEAVSLLYVSGIGTVGDLYNNSIRNIYAQEHAESQVLEEIGTLLEAFHQVNGEFRFLEEMDVQDWDEDSFLLEEKASKVLMSEEDPGIRIFEDLLCMQGDSELGSIRTVSDFLRKRILVKNRMTWRIQHLQEMFRTNLKIRIWELIADSDGHCTKSEILRQIPAVAYLYQDADCMIEELIREGLVRREEGILRVPMISVNTFALQQKDERLRRILLGILSGQTEKEIALTENIPVSLARFLVEECFCGERFCEDCYRNLICVYELSRKQFYTLFPEERQFVWEYLQYRYQETEIRRKQLWKAAEDPEISGRIRDRIRKSEVKKMGYLKKMSPKKRSARL